MKTDLDPRLRSAPSGIRAWVNQSLHPVGCIGSPQETGREALEEVRMAEAWLKEQGCSHARGPMEGSTFFAYRANLGPMDRAAFLGEPTSSPEPFTRSGYQVVAHYASALADNETQINNGREDGISLAAAGFRLVSIEAVGGFSEALVHFHRITAASFGGAHSYSPVSWELFQALYSPLESRIDPRLVRLALSPEGEVAGYCFSIPDLLNPHLDQFIVKTLAVDPRWRRHRLGSWLVSECHLQASTAGLSAGGIHALMWTGSHSRSISSHGGHVFRRYALYEKALL
jgi:GNAT superfamily N-acetyltransferase